MERLTVVLGNKSVPIERQELPPIYKLPVHYIADKRHPHMVNDIFPSAQESRRWSSKALPLAVLWAERSVHGREKLLKRCRKYEHPLILIYFDGGAPEQGLCPPKLRAHLGVGTNVIVFAWTLQPTVQQRAVLEFLHRNWASVPRNATTWLSTLRCIPIPE